MKRLVFAILIIAVLLAGGAAIGYRWVFARGESEGATVKVAIEPGTPGAQIAEKLESAGVVDSSLALRIYMRLNGVTSELRAGEYDLRQQMGFAELVAKLKKGPAVKFVKLRIPEGLTIEQTADKVAMQTHISREAFLAAAATGTVMPKFEGTTVSTLEGFLYPKTYFVTERESAESLVKRLVAQFDKETQSLPWDKAQSFGLTPFQLLVIASLIEEEAKADEERAEISAVIHNRLRRGMKLEIDATVQFLTKKYEGQPLTESDLNIDSPYNTRRYAGIPPGPIASPRASSIAAALTPSASNALFYVLTQDCRHHLFTSDYNEFLRARSRIPTNC